MDRHLVWPDLLNARDLGGLVLPSGRETAWHRVVRADNLNKLAPAGVAALVAYGVRTVIDLRDPFELEKFPNPLAAAPPPGVVFVSVPLISAAEWEAIKDPARATERYVLTARLSHANIAKAVAAVSDASPGGVVIHCHAGKERTGIVAALLLSLAGVDDSLVAEDWTASDAFLHGEHILDVLAHVRRNHGGVAEYLLAGGLGPDQVDRARRRLVSSGG